ncbi:helix-turn-helix transcriptional regulator [Leptospira ilyithenensis]|uniref:LuxR family transcriptional regulator n=1 Tax=Leptospira ilyithenensis TaxID=2484901 RepID=A0A4R9LL84_9LEPT|nr:helix-turn-helix transcriptional regulator [Leptospira ilyithenensis]TGN06529.1 LuxR family transcriptional regulator [Leptospira ilyithenensis]
MSFHLLLPKRSKFFLIYVLVVLFWMSLESIEVFCESKLATLISEYSAYFEIAIGILSLLGAYFVFLESISLRKEILESKQLIETLSHTNLLSKSNREEFWNGIQKQFLTWKYTETESEIATYLLRGFSNQQIAGIRGTSLRTIEAQIYSVYQKAGTRGKLDFIAYFIFPLLPDEK